MKKSRVKVATVKQLIFTVDEFYYLLETENSEIYLINFRNSKMTIEDEYKGITNYQVGDTVAIIKKRIIGRYKNGIIIPA